MFFKTWQNIPECDAQDPREDTQENGVGRIHFFSRM